MTNQEREHYEARADMYFVHPSPVEEAARERMYQAFKARLLLELGVEVPDTASEDPDSTVTVELVDLA